MPIKYKESQTENLEIRVLRWSTTFYSFLLLLVYLPRIKIGPAVVYINGTIFIILHLVSQRLFNQ
jgi:hypothetical protein